MRARVCVHVSNTGAVRDTGEETGPLPFELDLEKKAVFPSCQEAQCYAFKHQSAKTALFF